MRSLTFAALLALCAVSMASSYTRYRLYRSAEEVPKVEAEKSAPANEILANVTQEVAKTKMDVRTAKLEEATKSVEAVKVAATKAAEEQVISREDAAVIVKAADDVQKAADSGDHVQAINKMGQLHDQVDQVVAAQKGPEVAEKLVKANDDAIKPVLSSHEDLAILRAAVADVVNSDPLVPAEKKAEATEFTVKMIKEGFENANMTNRNLVATVESQAANLNLTSNATASANSDSVQSRVGRHTGFYHGFHYSPYYGYGLGYRNCLYHWPFSFCRRRLFGDYAFHHGFHHFYRRHHFHGRHRWW